MRRDHAVWEVERELARATEKFPPFNSYHEGYAVIKEEVDELWDEVKNSHGADRAEVIDAIRKEAVQVAAMALRFLEDCV